MQNRGKFENLKIESTISYCFGMENIIVFLKILKSFQLPLIYQHFFLDRE